MDEVDGKPLSQAARRNLQSLISVFADSQARALPSQRSAPEKVAAAVLDAFKLGHRIVNGEWVPKQVFRLQGGAYVTRDPNA